MSRNNEICNFLVYDLETKQLKYSKYNFNFELYKLKGFHYPWIGYLANDSNIIVGAAGFNGRPQNNIVEISYYTFEEYQGKGFASNACTVAFGQMSVTNKDHHPRSTPISMTYGRILCFKSSYVTADIQTSPSFPDSI